MKIIRPNINKFALLDRVTHHCEIIETGNESYRLQSRLKENKQTALLPVASSLTQNNQVKPVPMTRGLLQDNQAELVMASNPVGGTIATTITGTGGGFTLSQSVTGTEASVTGSVGGVATRSITGTGATGSGFGKNFTHSQSVIFDTGAIGEDRQ